MAEALCCISVDIDAVAGWLGSYGGEDSTSDISRGVNRPGSIILWKFVDQWKRIVCWYRWRPQTSEALRKV